MNSRMQPSRGHFQPKHQNTKIKRVRFAGHFIYLSCRRLGRSREWPLFSGEPRATFGRRGAVATILDTMTTTRASAAFMGKGANRAKESHGALMVLNDDLLLAVIKLLDMRTQLCLGMCSPCLYTLVSSPELWTEINFMKLGHDEFGARSAKITDEVLNAFLERVNARAITTKISLEGCVLITGSGLSPLCGSKVLKEINLRTNAWSSTPHPVALNRRSTSLVLRSMLTLECRLETILLPRQRELTAESHARVDGDFESWDQPWRSILRELRETIKARTLAVRSCCAHCDRLLSEDQMQSESACTAPVSQLTRPSCGRCKQLTCRAEKCAFLIECSPCGRVFCELCAPGEESGTCDQCHETYCGDCRETDACDVCGKIFCEGCRMVRTCNVRPLPIASVNSTDDYSRSVISRRSQVCETTFCEEHADLYFCEECDEFFCDGCHALRGL